MFWRKKKTVKLLPPAKGKLVKIDEVPDEVFSQKMMGDGYALVPEDGTFVAPIDGVLESVFDTGHAYGITGDDGIELLVHIGIDTVELRGQGFQILKQAGEKVKAGDPVIQVDLDFVKQEGYNTITPVVLLNKENPALEIKEDFVILK